MILKVCTIVLHIIQTVEIHDFESLHLVLLLIQMVEIQIVKKIGCFINNIFLFLYRNNLFFNNLNFDHLNYK